jgi:hypothetical protein
MPPLDSWVLSRSDLIWTQETFKFLVDKKAFWSEWYSWLWLGSYVRMVEPGLKQVLLGLIAYITNPSLSMKLIIILSWILAGVSMYFVTYRFFKSYVVAFISALAYIFNSYIARIAFECSRFIGFIFFPLLLYAYINALLKKDLKYVVLSALLLTILLIIHTEFPMIFLPFMLSLALLLFFEFSSKSRYKDASIVLLRFFTVGLLFISFGSFFFLEHFFNSQVIAGKLTPEPYELQAYSLKLIDAFSFWTYSREPFLDSWVENNFFSLTFGLLISTMAFASLLFKYRRREGRLIIYLNLCSILSVVLSMGVNIAYSPYKLLELIPFYSSIRTPFRFIKVHIVTSSILTGVVLGRLLNFNMLHASRTRCTLTIILIVFIFTLGFVQSFLFSSQFSSRLGNVLSDNSLANVVEILKNDPDDFIVLGIPPVTHLPHDLYDTLDIAAPNYVLSAFHGKRSFEGPGMAYAYPKIVILDKYLASSLYFMKFGGKVGDVLGLFNIKYLLIYKKLVNNQDQVWFPIDANLIRYLLLQPDLKQVYEDDKFILLRNEKFQPRVRTASTALLVFGGLGTLQALPLLNTYDYVNTNIIFYDQNGQMAQVLANNATNEILIYNVQFEDIIFAFLSEEYKLKLDNFASHKINLFKHILLSPIYDDIVYDYTVIALKWNESIKVPFNVKVKGNYSLLIRSYICPESGKLSLFITDNNNNIVIAIDDIYGNFLYSKNSWSFKWIKIPLINLKEGGYTLSLRSSSELNYINAIAVIPQELLDNLYKKVLAMLMDKNVAFIYEAEDNIKPVGPCSYIVEFSSPWRQNAVSNSIWLSNMSSGGSILLHDEGILEFTVPHEANYKITIRYLPITPNASLLVEIDRLEVENISTYEVLKWNTAVTHILLKPGMHTLTLKVKGEIAIDLIAIESQNRQSNINNFTNEKTMIDFTEKAQGNFIVNVNATNEKLFYIIVLDTFDQGWVAYYQSGKVRSIESLYCFNSFLIQLNDKSKNVTAIDIRYEGTPLRVTGQIISLLTFITCFVVVIAGKVLKKAKEKNALRDPPTQG